MFSPLCNAAMGSKSFCSAHKVCCFCLAVFFLYASSLPRSSIAESDHIVPYTHHITIGALPFVYRQLILCWAQQKPKTIEKELCKIVSLNLFFYNFSGNTHIHAKRIILRCSLYFFFIFFNDFVGLAILQIFCCVLQVPLHQATPSKMLGTCKLNTLCFIYLFPSAA